jgi:hypothetical protein
VDSNLYEVRKGRAMLVNEHIMMPKHAIDDTLKDDSDLKWRNLLSGS